MNLSELRIGNWYGHNAFWSAENHKALESHVFKMDLHHFRFLCESSLDIEQILPIEITDEILVKANFKKDQDGRTFNLSVGNGELRIGLLPVPLSYFIVYISGPFGMIQPKKIKYVHELQDLLLVNAGEQLAIEL
jgi:hypothetical protein